MGGTIPIDGVVSESVCACSLCSRLVSLCQNGEQTTESWTGHPLKLQSPELATPKKWQSPKLATHKLKVLDFAIFWGGQFRTLLFFPQIWHRGKLGGGKNKQTPCTVIFISMPRSSRNSVFTHQAGGLSLWLETAFCNLKRYPLN